MRNLNPKKFAYLIVILSGLIWFILAWFYNLDISKVDNFFGLTPKVISIDLILLSLFTKWGWKFNIFKGWLVPYPDLNGSWTGYIYSNWQNPQTGDKPPPIPTMLTIKQSFFYISCVMHTAEMKSFSYIEGFVIDSERQLKQLTYVYTSKPNLSVLNRSKPHDGTTVFDIIEKPDLKLTGRYWTERETTGEIKLEFKSKSIWEELPEDLGKHPVSTVDN
jgi:hypothetical protein